MKNNNIDNLRQRISIVDVLNNFIKLQRRGNNFVAICPFHDDHHASLTVNEKKKIYKCFSCNAGGDVFNFIKNFNHVSFQEAVLEACKIANIDDNTIGSLKQQLATNANFDHLYALNEQANEYFKMFLNNKENQYAKDYLINQRHFTKTMIEQFDIGFSPNDKTVLLELLTNNNNILKNNVGYSYEDLKEVGLIKINHEGNFESYFTNRITFPIYDQYNHLVGFSARTIENQENVSKYLNTPATKIFNKSAILYHLNKIIADDLESLYILEGFMDVIALSKIDVTNTVATMGVSLTKEHVDILKQFNQLKSIILTFDNDQAGKEAIHKAAKLLINDFDVYVINYLSNHKDFDELVNDNPELAKQTINNIIHYDTFLINEKLATNKNINNEVDKNNLINELIEILKNIKNEYILIENVHHIADVLNINADLLLQALTLKRQTKQYSSRKNYSNSKFKASTKNNDQIIFNEDKKTSKIEHVDQINVLSEAILKCCLYHRENADFFFNQEIYIESSFFKNLINNICNLYYEHQEIDSFIDNSEATETLLKSTFDDKQYFFIKQLITNLQKQNIKYDLKKVQEIIKNYKICILINNRNKLQIKFKQQALDEKSYYEAIHDINEQLKLLQKK